MTIPGTASLPARLEPEATVARGGTASARRAWLAVGVTGGLVAFSLVVRLVHRGAYYPGFDVVGAANGLYLLSTHGAWNAFTTVFASSRTYGSPFPYFSALCALVPGFLASIRPWEQWGGVVTFALFLTMLWLLLRANALRLRDGWIVLLAWSASSALLSFSVTGFGWSTAFLPHALALFVVLDPRLRARVLPTLVLSLLALEVSWHVYELGRTVFVVFIVAALVLRPVPLRTRVIWIAVAALQLWMIDYFPGSHAVVFSHLEHLERAEMWARLAAVGRMLFVSPYLDLPLLVVAAGFSCLVPSRRRTLLALLLLVQLALVAMLALRTPSADEVRPRRFLLVDSYCLALVVSCLAETRGAIGPRRAVRAGVIGILVAGSAWQVADLMQFVRTPFERKFGSVFTLPFVRSQVDYMTSMDDVDWANELGARADAGENLFLVYDLGAYDENYTNPSASLERLYLHLGHDHFIRSVFAFGSAPCRHSCIPIRPMNELVPFLDAVAGGTGPSPASFTGYWVVEQQFDTEGYLADRARVLAALRERFTLTVETSPGAKYQRFRLAPRSAA